MSQTWKRWEGQVVNGEFPLLRFLGGSNHSAVFLTERRAGAPSKAAIKLVSTGSDGGEGQLRRWKNSAALGHPHLLRLYESGRCILEGTSLLFVVMELAEEDLSQILPERALAPAEVRQMLVPFLDVLSYLHDQKWVHGRLRPSNILASGDQVKLSSDTLRASDETVASSLGMDGYDPPEAPSAKLTPAADAWSFAITLVEVLTQRRPSWDPAEPATPSLPAGLQEPFVEIARHCLQVDPQQRWTIPEIEAGLQPADTSAQKSPSASAAAVTAVGKSKPRSMKWPFGVAAIVIAAVVLIALVPKSGPKKGNSTHMPEVQPQEAGPSGGALPESSSAPAKAKPSAAAHAKKSSAHESVAKMPPGAVVKGSVLQQVSPRVSPSARQTIDGRIKVAVRVEVDSSGKVTEAKLISPGPSKYFARLALEAAREWKFTPAQMQGQAVASEWNLRFGFRRSGTDVVSTETAP